MKRTLWIILGISLIVGGVGYFIGFNQGENNFRETGLVVQDGNNTYYKHLDYYYNVSAKSDSETFELGIDNPCIVLQKVSGDSMKPYWEEESILLIDTCFPARELEIGDVILYYFDWNMTARMHHRIIDIDYEKEWIKTKGDDLEAEDQIVVSFNQVYGKEIGVLNVLSDEKVVTEIIGGNSEEVSLTCVCSSNSILKVCGPDKEQLMTDSFVVENNLKEENCEVIE